MSATGRAEEKMSMNDRLIGNTILTAKTVLDELLNSYEGDIVEAWDKARDENGDPVPMAISITLNLKPETSGQIKLETSLAFVKERCKVKATALIDDQPPLPFDGGGKLAG
jgi:hypothetical protein